MSANRTSWYRIEAAADNTPAEVFIYDRIGESYWGDGVGAKNFARELAGIDAYSITVRINSPGGSVTDGIAILNALREHKARITVYVDGLAASAASFIAMAGDEIIMSRNAEMMIHDPMLACAGNADDMRAAAARLEQVGENIASIYAERAGGDAETWRTAMRAETWYSDAEAVEAGLADKVAAAKRDGSGAKNDFDLSIFNYAGRHKAPAPTPHAAKAAAPAPEIPAAEHTTEGGSDVAFTDEQTSELREALSLPEDATIQAIYDAALEKLTEPAASPADNSVASLVNQLAKHGLAAIENSRLQAFEADAAKFQAFIAKTEQADREAKVSNAIRLGQIPTASKEHWLKTLAVDPGAADVLASLPKGLIPVDELGHSVDPTAAAADLGWFGETTSKGA